MHLRLLEYGRKAYKPIFPVKIMAKKWKKRDSPGALFIPAGIFLGFGFGFAFNNLPAGMFFGMGAGFVGFAIAELLKKR